jgi:hypothetical protein
MSGSISTFTVAGSRILSVLDLIDVVLLIRRPVNRGVQVGRGECRGATG